MKAAYLYAQSAMQNGLLSQGDIFPNAAAVKNTDIGIKFEED